MIRSRFGIVLFALFLLVAAPLPRVGGSELILIKDGISHAPIVVFKGAPPKTRRAADELAEYIEKSTGVRPEVVEGQPDPIPPRAVWVGYQPVLTELFPKLNFEFEHPEEILIAANENHLVITGRDRWSDDHLNVPGLRVPIVGRQREYGTINAVYTFLQDFLDVRWLWPGESGIDVIKRDTIAFKPFEYRYHPRFRLRSTLLRLSDLGDNRGLAREWTRFQRLQLDSIRMEVGGHAYTDWWARFHETNPEYFALQPDGTRSGFPDPPKVKLCQSNPAVWKQWLTEVEAAIARDPNQTIFEAGPNDSYHRGWCVCPNCLAWDHPDAERRLFVWQGLSQEHVAASDRDVTYYNKLSELLKQRFPDRELYVQGSAYGNTRPAPVKARPADNIIIASVANFLIRQTIVDHGTTHRDQFRAWGEVAQQVVWRPNIGNPAGWQQGLPSVAFGRAIDDIQFAARYNCVGIAVDTVWEHWITQGPLYYVMGHLIWNPAQDGRAVLDDYYRRGFGPAAEPIKAYWTLLEEVSTAMITGEFEGDWSNADEQLARAGRLLDLADTAAASGPAIYRQRLAYVRGGYTYTTLMAESARLKRQWEASKGQDVAAAARIRENSLAIERINAEHPNAFTWNFVRPGAKRTMAHHLPAE